MTRLDASDPHAPYVRELADAGDWASLARYCMAHGLYAPALDRAIELVHRRAISEVGPWPALAGFLEDFRDDPISFERQPPAMPLDDLSYIERGTLDLLLILPRVVLCQFGNQYPAEYQNQFFQAGITAANHASAIAKSLDDGACQAFLTALKADAQRELNDLESARTTYEEALASYRELARQRPDVHWRSVAIILNNLGIVHSVLNDPESARAAYTEALTSCRDLAQQRPELYRPDVAMALNNLGNVQLELNDPDSARELRGGAGHPPRSRAEVARALSTRRGRDAEQPGRPPQLPERPAARRG